MKTVYHSAESRGHAMHGWLESYHSFSFASFHNPERMHFGLLRVLNDDLVAPGRGFGTHGHRDMEIISIPLQGELEHRDNMGNTAIIREGDIQVLSAGTGIEHSEYNHSMEHPVSFLQIWIFPREKNLSPRYDQVSFNQLQQIGGWTEILSPDQQGQGVWIHQDAWFHIGKPSKGMHLPYSLRKSGNGLYVFVLDGTVKAGEKELGPRDALGIWETDSVNFEALSDCNLLLMEVPMKP